MPEIQISNSVAGVLTTGVGHNTTGGIEGQAHSLTYTHTNLMPTSGNLTISWNGFSATTNCIPSLNGGIANNLTPGSSDSWDVDVFPNAAGAWSFTCSLGNNDVSGGENPFVIIANGTAAAAPAPDIEPRTGALPGPTGDIVIRAHLGFDPVAGTVLNETSTVMYDIWNVGNANLTSVSAVITAQNNCTASITTPPAVTITPSTSSPMVVQVTPNNPADLSWTYDLSITSNDPDEPTYSWISRDIADAPEITILNTGTSNPIIDGVTNDVISGTTVNSQTSISYTIVNAGSATLSGLSASTTGTTNCTIGSITQPATSVGVSSNTIFAVPVAPTASGWSFGLSVSSNDADENPYTWIVSGNAALQNPGSNIADAGADTVNGTTIGTQSTLTYTISNTGTGSLSVSSPVVTPILGCVAALASSPASIVTPSNSTQFSVVVTPSAANWSFTISIQNNDSDENPYDLNVSGVAV